MTRKIAVPGTGANGSCISADLTRGGYRIERTDRLLEMLLD